MFYEIDTCSQFCKTFFAIIYAVFGVLPKVLTQVMALEALIGVKKSYEIDTSIQFHKTFLQ
jgi:hypothetical protein